MKIKFNIEKVIRNHPLKDREHYSLYLLRYDPWPFGFIADFSNAEEIASRVKLAMNSDDIRGVWVTKESDDGTVDTDIFKLVTE